MKRCTLPIEQSTAVQEISTDSHVLVIQILPNSTKVTAFEGNSNYP